MAKKVKPGHVLGGLLVAGGIFAIIHALTRKAKAAGLVGDLDNDGAITWADYNILVSYIVNQGTPAGEVIIAQSGLTREEFLRRADVNGDGEINALDITALEILLEAPPEPPPEPPPDRSVAITLKNPPYSNVIERWQMRLYPYKGAGSITFRWSSLLRINETAKYGNLPSEFKPPFPLQIELFYDLGGEDWEVRHKFQSYSQLPGYGLYWPVWIPDFGSYYFNYQTKEFERVL